MPGPALIRSLPLLCLLATGCMPNSSIDPSSLPTGPLRYQQVGGVAGMHADGWWRSLSDRRLDQDVTLALKENFEQRQLASRIQQASATLRREGSALFPQVDLTASADQESIRGTSSATSASFGSLLSWEVDVWGRIRSGVRARQSELEAAYQDWLGGRLMLSAAVAETRVGILGQRARLKVLGDQIETNTTLLKLIRSRVGQGIASRVDLLQQERQLDATRALVPTAEAELAAAEYALDVLVGRAPGSGSRDSRNSLPELPPLPPSGVPSELLKNRPDLLASWNRILALDAGVGQALADRLPRIVIGAGADRGSFDGVGSTITGLIAEATLPVVDGGARRAEADRRKALLEDALLGYSNDYLEAIRDVESAIVRERKQAERIRLTLRQLETARATLEETRIRYSQGLSDYLPVIDALTSVQVLELAVVSLRREALVLRIGLHRALGGPMPQTPPPDFPS